MALLIAGALASGPAHGADPVETESTAVTPDADRRAELDRLYSEGQQRFAAQDFAGAIDSFSAGLELSPAGDLRGNTYFTVSLAIAHLEQHLAEGTEDDLARALELLREAVDGRAELLTAEPRLEALARRNLARAQQRDRELHPPEPEPEPAPEPAVQPLPAPTPAPVPTGPDKRRSAGLGLVVTGTVLVVGGVAIFVDGATLESRARAIAEKPPMGAQKDYIDNEVPRLARIRYAIAGPVAAIGIGLLVGGGILLRRASRSPRPVTLHPWAAPTGAGLNLSGSF